MKLLKHLPWVRRGLTWRQRIRFPLQTVVAVLLSYAVMRIFGLPEASWAVFSSLFVVQGSVGGTLDSAMQRVLGAAIGVALGIAVLTASEHFDLTAATSMAIGVALMSILVSRYSVLSYGLVAVAIITLTREQAPLADALQKTLAIVVGSSAGVAAGICVIPLSARQSVRDGIAVVARECGALIVDCANVMTECGEGSRSRIQLSIETSLSDAREMARAAHRELPRQLPTRYWPPAQVRAAERLWYTLAALERLSQKPLPDQARKMLGESINRAADSSEKRLREIAQALASGNIDQIPTFDAGEFRALAEAFEDFLRTARLAGEERDRVYAAKWVWEYVCYGLDEFSSTLR